MKRLGLGVSKVDWRVTFDFVVALSDRLDRRWLRGGRGWGFEVWGVVSGVEGLGFRVTLNPEHRTPWTLNPLNPEFSWTNSGSLILIEKKQKKREIRS